MAGWSIDLLPHDLIHHSLVVKILPRPNIRSESLS